MEKKKVIKKAIDTLWHLFSALSVIQQVIAIILPSGTTITVVVIMPSISPFIIGIIAVIVWIVLFFSTIYALGWYNLTKQTKGVAKENLKKSLEALLVELRDNRRLADKNEKKGYDTTAFTNAKKTMSFHVLPPTLRNTINDAQIMLLNAQLRDKPHLYYVDLIDIERLKKLYEVSIPELEEYLERL